MPPHELLGCLNVSINSGKSVTHCECALHSFSASRPGTHRTTEEPVTVCGTEDSRAGRASAADADHGAGGEKLSHAQLELFELEPVVSEMTEQAESEHAPVHRSTNKSAKHPGRQELPANLPRVERLLPCALDQRV